MSKLESLIDAGEHEHPDITALKIKCADLSKCAISVTQERNGPSYDPVIIGLFFPGPGGALSLMKGDLPWDGTLNVQLIKCGVRAMTVDQESLRFSIMLRDELRGQDVRRGSGYVTSSLALWIRQNEFFESAKLKEIFDGAALAMPDPDSRSYSDCRDAIVMHVSILATMLKRQLGYTGDAKLKWDAILANAIGEHFDHRTTFSLRKQLGWA